MITLLFYNLCIVLFDPTHYRMLGRGVAPTGRGRARLLPNQEVESSTRLQWVSTSVNAPLSFEEKISQINTLFQKTILPPLSVYKILYACLLKKPTSDRDIQEMTDIVMKLCETDATNMDTICKYYYLLSRHKEPNNIRQHFYNSLEKKFNERDQTRRPESFRNYCLLFLYATHFMRHPDVAPIEDIFSGLLMIISSLPKSKERTDYDIHAQTVAWCSSYLKLRENKDGNNRIQRLALGEAMNVIRERVINGTGNIWDLACLETASAGGSFSNVLDYNYYNLELREYQLQLLANTDIHQVTIPSEDETLYNLDNFHEFVQVI